MDWMQLYAGETNKDIYIKLGDMSSIGQTGHTPIFIRTEIEAYQTIVYTLIKHVRAGPNNSSACTSLQFCNTCKVKTKTIAYTSSNISKITNCQNPTFMTSKKMLVYSYIHEILYFNNLKCIEEKKIF